MTRDELVAWGDLDAAALKAELARRFDPFWSIPRMAQQQVDVLRSVIHPEVTLSAVKQPSRTDAPVAADLAAAHRLPRAAGGEREREAHGFLHHEPGRLSVERATT